MKPTGTAVAKRQHGAHTDPCKQLCQIDMPLRYHLCLEIGEFLKAKTFSRIFNIFNFYKEQLTSNEVSCPAAILFWGSRIQNEAQTDLRIITHAQLFATQRRRIEPKPLLRALRLEQNTISFVYRL